ncbi:MAG: hypothetical protein ACLFQX_02600 [Candidatus Kapaibacterium sp.]
MTIDSVQKQEPASSEKPPITVQNEIRKEMLRDAAGTGAGSTQRQLLQLLASAQPQQQIQQTAQSQIEKGYLDVKV